MEPSNEMACLSPKPLYMNWMFLHWSPLIIWCFCVCNWNPNRLKFTSLIQDRLERSLASSDRPCQSMIQYLHCNLKKVLPWTSSLRTLVAEQWTYIVKIIIMWIISCCQSSVPRSSRFSGLHLRCKYLIEKANSTNLDEPFILLRIVVESPWSFSRIFE